MPNHFCYLPGRLAVLTVGAATVVLAYRLAIDVYRRSGLALAAEAILSFLPVPVEGSR